MKRKKQTVDKMDFIVQKIHWIVSAIIRIGKIPCITQQMHQGIWMKMEKIQKSPAQRCDC